MLAAIIALLIALSQWARWGGLIEWDVLSAAAGLAQSAQLRAGAFPTEKMAGFDCPNLALDPHSPIFSDAQLRAVGQEICNSSSPVVQALRGTDGSIAGREFARKQGRKRVVANLVSPVEAPAKELPKRTYTIANFEPRQTGGNREILEEVERSARTLDALDPCATSVRRCDDHSDGPSSGSGKDEHVDKDRDDKWDDKDSGHGDRDDDHDGPSGHDDDSDDSSHDGDSDHDGDNDDDHDGEYDVAENDSDHSGSGGGGDRDDGDRDGDDRDGGDSDRDGDDRDGGDRDGDDRDDDDHDGDGDRSGSGSGSGSGGR